MGYYLLDHPPARRQYRTPRRSAVSGVIVLHTAENATDIVGADQGAEAVARFIARRTDNAGSYHRIGDRDSEVPMLPYSYEAFHDGTGSNPHSIGLSLAMRAADWPTLSREHRNQLVDRMASMAAHAAHWVRTTTGIIVPAIRRTKAQTDDRLPGFIAHGDRDPGRRSDPGRDFPWDQFLTRFTIHVTKEIPADMTALEDEVKWWQAQLNETPFEPKLAVDGDRGPLTEARADAVVAAATTALELPDRDDEALGAAAREFLAEWEAQGPR